MAGYSVSARTTAHPMMCVNDTLPPSARRRSWLLTMRRLTSSSFAGNVRTEVAVGRSRLSPMRLAMAAPAPFS